MKLRATLKEIGIIIYVGLATVFNLFYKGQELLDLLYYTLLPFSFCLVLLSIRPKTELVQLGIFTSFAITVYCFLKLIGVVNYNYNGTKVLIPVIIFLYFIYTKLRKWLQSQ